MTSDPFKTKCVNHHDFCDQMSECPYCEIVMPPRHESGKFGKLVEWSLAGDEGWNAKDAAKIAGVSVSAAYKAAKRLGFKWPQKSISKLEPDEFPVFYVKEAQ